MSNVKQVIGDTFAAEVLKSEVPVVVDFYADWCGPCRMLAPILDRMAEEFEGDIKFVRVNSDQEPDLSQAYQVSALPTVVFVDGGKAVGQFTGLPQEDALRDELKKWIESRKIQSP